MNRVIRIISKKNITRKKLVKKSFKTFGIKRHKTTFHQSILAIRNINCQTNFNRVIRRFYSSAPPNVKFQVLEFPALSPTMEEGKIASWSLKPGDKIDLGKSIAEIETDKATISMDSAVEGYLAKILVEPGNTIKVGVPIGIVVSSKQDIDAVKDYTPSGKSAEPTTQKTEVSQSTTAPSPPPSTEAPKVTQAVESGNRIFASPIAKKISQEKGIDLKNVKGTGPSGRIIKSDVEEFKAPQAPRVDLGIAYEDISLNNIKKITAQRLTLSKQTIPHYYCTIECNVDKLLELRVSLNEMAKGEYKLSVNDFIIKACAMSMRKVPVVNSEWRGDVIRQYKDVNVNVAVNTDRGLFIPVVKEVNKKGLTEISNSVKTLAEKAKNSSLSMNDIEGGTFTVSNLGMFGIKHFAAVINPPQSAILAVGGTDQKLVLEGEKVVSTSTMSFTLSCDHRVIDGAVAAQWLQEFRRIIENPVSLML